MTLDPESKSWDTYAALHQGVYWKTATGRTMRIVPGQGDEKYPVMGRFHARNCLNLLERRASHLHFCAYISASGFLATINGEMAQDAIEREIDAEFEQSPLAWLRSTELYRSIERRSRGVSKPLLEARNRAWKLRGTP